jgi:hypothetical protein
MIVDTPANMQAIQEQLINVFTFEVIDGDIFKENLWKFEGSEDVDPYKESCGYDSKLF